MSERGIKIVGWVLQGIGFVLIVVSTCPYIHLFWLQVVMLVLACILSLFSPILWGGPDDCATGIEDEQDDDLGQGQ